MNCIACGHRNPERAKFCLECGAPAATRCPSCGTELPFGAKFCLECGAKIGGNPVSARKTVTILFADLAGSTALHERLDPESVTVFMESYYGAMRGAVEAHGGTVVKLLGDGVMAAFGVPRVAEDDAIRGVRAGVAMQQAFRDLAVQTSAAVGTIGLRVALNTGEVVVSADHTDVVGDPVNVAARLQQEAGDGDVVVGESTQRLVAALVTLAPLGSFALKGRAEAVRAYLVASLERPASAIAAAFVGRDDELARVAAVYEAAVAKPAARLAVLLGSPGLGKSRLIDEITGRLGEAASVVSAHCDAAGGATFAPLAEGLRDFLHVDDGGDAEALRAVLEAAVPVEDAERTRIIAGIGALLTGSPASPEETFFVVRRLLAALASVKPVVLVIDDLHWAEPLLLDLVEHLVQWGSGVPLLVLVGARPELRDTRSSLATPGNLVADVVTLAGLDAGATMRLAANVIGAADLPAAVAAKVLATSEGNPLFVAELVRMLVQEGALEREGDRWTTGSGLADLEMPPTIHALLAARIERLRPEERGVLERAAVVGRHFSRNAVAELMPREVTDLDARLESLRRSELIEPDTGWFLGEPVLRFHHVLIRDAAYRRLLKGTRAELHSRFADWVEGRSTDTIEHDETIGWHLEQAHRHLLELGPIDAKGKALGERAASHLAAAGHRALARDDLPLAAGLLGRALARLEREDPARAELALDWCEALLAAGDVVPAAKAIEELARFLSSPSDSATNNLTTNNLSSRLSAWHTCFTGQLTALTAPQSLHATVDAVAAAAALLAGLGDTAGEAKAHFVHAQAFARLGKIGACEAALDRALAAARKAGDRRRANTVLAVAPLAALWGPSPVTRASGRCLDVVRVLRITQGAPAVEAVALSCQGVLEALRGRTDAARRMIASARKMVEDLGITQRLLETDVFAGRIDLLEGDAIAAERCLRGAYEGLRDLGLGIDAARTAALLGRALLEQDRAAEAEEMSHQSEALAGDDLQASIAWRGVRAEALARGGDHAAAVELAQAAVEIAAATDALLDHADARRALAAALRAAGRNIEADAEEQRATELWETKGATLLAERARSDGGRIEVLDVHQEDDALARFAELTTNPAQAPPLRRVQPNEVTQLEFFEPDHEAEALARLRELVGSTDAEHARESASRFVNAATRLNERLSRAWVAGDWETIAAIHAAKHHLDDRRRFMQMRLPAETAMAQLRVLFDVPGSRWVITPIATRGEQLALSRYLFYGAVDAEGGPLAIDYLAVDEIDGDGRFAEIVLLDPDDFDAAYAELDRRYEAGEGAAHAAHGVFMRAFTEAVACRDWEPVLALCTPAFVEYDHRRLAVLGTTRSAETWAQNFRTLTDLAPDTVYRVDHFRSATRGFWSVGTWHGSREGGHYEIPINAVLEMDDRARLAQADIYDPDQLDQASARFDELGEVAAPTERFANAATRALHRGTAALAARDWEGFTTLFAAQFRHYDRTRIAQLETDGQVWLASFRQMVEMTVARPTQHVVATRGDRLALLRLVWRGADGDIGPSEIEWLIIVEVDGRGDHTAVVAFDPDDLDAAYAELAARWEAGEAATHPHASAWGREFQRAFAARDWEALAALHAPDQVAMNHRIVGWGTLRGPGAWVPTLQALVDLAPDTRFRIDHLRTCERGFLWQSAWHGTRDGGPFETPLLIAVELDALGWQIRMDVWDADVFDQARARFEELAEAAAAPQPFANTATATVDPVIACMVAHDWQGFAQLFAEDFRCSDRRRLVQLELDRDRYVAFTRGVADGRSIRAHSQLLATRGDRLALARSTVEFTDADVGPSEIAFLILTQVDDRGRIVAYVRFDLEDLDAATAELDARWEAGEASAHPLASKRLADYRRFFAVRDWNAMAATMAPDLVSHSHRAAIAKGNAASAGLDRWRVFEPGAADAADWDALRASCAPDMIFEDRQGFARLSGDREMMIASLRERVASGASAERRLLGTAGERIAVTRMLWTGGPADGRFEIEYLSLVEVDESGLVAAIILFGADDARAAQREAWARWGAIDPARAAVAAVLGEILDASNEHDRVRYRAALADDLILEDHRHAGVGSVAGADAYLSSLEPFIDLAPDKRAELGWTWLACEPHGALTVGRRCGIAFADGGAYESDYLYLCLVAGGCLTRIELFELEAVDAALARFEELRIPPSPSPPSVAK